MRKGHTFVHDTHVRVRFEGRSTIYRVYIGCVNVLRIYMMRNKADKMAETGEDLKK